MSHEDPFDVTIKRRLPLGCGLLAALLSLPALYLAALSGMTGPSLEGRAFAVFLILQPLLLGASAVAGFRCYRGYRPGLWAVAVLPVPIAMLAMKAVSSFG